MKKQKKAFILVLISISFILGLTGKETDQNHIEPFVQTFQKTGAVLDSYWLHIGIPYGMYVDDQQLLKTGNELSSWFELPQLKDLTEIQSQKGFAVKGTWGEETEAELRLIRQNEQTKEMYLIFRLKGTDSLEKMQSHYKRLHNILEKIRISPIISSCIQGNINDTLDDVRQLTLIEEVIHNLSAEKVEMLDTKLVKSISAYSPKLGYSIWTGHQKMNLQIAAHVNKIEQKTILTMGTPIITIEY